MDRAQRWAELRVFRQQGRLHREELPRRRRGNRAAGRILIRRAPIAPIAAGHLLGDNVAPEQGQQFVVFALGYFGAVVFEIVQNLAQFTARARLNLHLGSGGGVGIPLNRQQVAAAAQANEVGPQRNLRLKAFAVELQLGYIGRAGANGIQGPLKAAKPRLDRLELLAFKPRDGARPQRRLGGPLEAAVGREAAVGKIHSVAGEQTAVVNQAEGIDPIKRTQVEDQLQLGICHRRGDSVKDAVEGCQVAIDELGQGQRLLRIGRDDAAACEDAGG